MSSFPAFNQLESVVGLEKNGLFFPEKKFTGGTQWQKQKR